MKYYIKTDNSYLSGIELNIDDLLEKCVEEIDGLLMHNPEIYVYGKKCNQHRSIGFFSNESIGYRYSGQLAESIRLTPNTELLLNYVNSTLTSDFNGILVNKYANGEDYIGKHSDDEKCLSNLGVVSISYLWCC
jgi:alpha-ketoglutarate-dependent dioxygenase alkB family protein 2